MPKTGSPSLGWRAHAYGDTEHRIRTAPISPARRHRPGATRGGFLADWSGDGRFLVVENDCDLPERVFRVSVQSGERTPWKELQPNDVTGVIQVTRAFFTSDGAGCAYKYFRTVSSDLYLAEGLK